MAAAATARAAATQNTSPPPSSSTSHKRYKTTESKVNLALSPRIIDESDRSQHPRTLSRGRGSSKATINRLNKQNGSTISELSNVSTIQADQPITGRAPRSLSVESVSKTILHANSKELDKLQSELDRMKKEVSTYREVVESQTDLLESVRSSLSCNICLEILDSPYALVCGHIFCHKDLYSWFHRNGSDFDSEQELFNDDDESDLERAEMEGQLRHNMNMAGRLMQTTFRNLQHQHRPFAGVIRDQPHENNINGTRPPRGLSAHRRKNNLICPQCRAAVKTRPFQLYAIKEATDRLRKSEQNSQPTTSATSSGPMSANDDQDHRDEKDLTWGNLFTDSINDSPQARHVVRDAEDGVRRCGRCAWEIGYNGLCEGCGEVYSDEDDSDHDDESSTRGLSDSEDMGTNYGTDDEHPSHHYFRRSNLGRLYDESSDHDSRGTLSYEPTEFGLSSDEDPLRLRAQREPDSDDISSHHSIPQSLNDSDNSNHSVERSDSGASLDGVGSEPDSLSALHSDPYEDNEDLRSDSDVGSDSTGIY